MIFDMFVVEVDLEVIKVVDKEIFMIVLVINMDCVKNFVLEKIGKVKVKVFVMDVKV